MDGHGGQVCGAQAADQQADAVEHHAGGCRAEDGVFQGRLAALPAKLEHAGQDVRRHAGHLDAQEDDQHVVGRDHQAHAQRGTQDQNVELGPVLALGDAGGLGEGGEQQGEEQQQPSHVHGEGVEDQRPSEDLDRLHDDAAHQVVPGRRQVQRRAGADHHQIEGVGFPPTIDHPQQQHRDDRCADHQFRPEPPKRRRERIIQYVMDQSVKAHGRLCSFGKAEGGRRKGGRIMNDEWRMMKDQR